MKYTPCSVAAENQSYSIPIYQRLFEWDAENIQNLLDDLKHEFDHGRGDYYIGMLTSTKDNELIDGQQRFTVMMLLGAVLQSYYPEWENFLLKEDRLRLDFSARPLDNNYLKILIDNESAEKQSVKNLKMLQGYDKIRKFMEVTSKFSDVTRRDFAEFVYRHLSFFISRLPEGYKPNDLNKYFERMNTTGKNLEQHEILKVKLLSNLPKDIDRYMLLWNKIADTDTKLIRPRNEEGEGERSERKRRAISGDIQTILDSCLLNGLDETEHTTGMTIGKVHASSEKPRSGRETNNDSRCAINFPHLLLQVLYRKLNRKIEGSINDFFNPANLISTFEYYLPFSGPDVNAIEIMDFMERLVKARLALDICFIRPTDYGYSLDMNLPEGNPMLRQLMMQQSMIYVSSSNYTNYRWFNWLMDEIDRTGIPDAGEFYNNLKDKLDRTFPLPDLSKLHYGHDINYWFWRLDLCIWENRTELFCKDSMELAIAENYVFRRNRSVEHIAPQTPQTDSTLKWNDTDEDAALRNSFGNLAMISKGLNSALSNQSYEMKKAHVQSFCNGSKTGSIESLKLLMVYHDYPQTWTRESIREHGAKMYELLANNCNSTFK